MVIEWGYISKGHERSVAKLNPHLFPHLMGWEYMEYILLLLVTAQ